MLKRKSANRTALVCVWNKVTAIRVSAIALNILINLPLYKFQKRLEVDSYLDDFIEDQSLRNFLLKNLKRGGDD